MRILLVEDDRELAEITAENLKNHGLAVDIADSGQEAKSLLEIEDGYDVVVLDLNLPDADGFELLEELKLTAPQTPFLALTARDAEEDRIRGIKNGFDDYMTKPFSHRELAARLRVLYRSQPQPAPEIIEVGPLSIHPRSQVVLREGVPLDLTLNEFRLLLFLAQSPGRGVSKEELLREVWDTNSDEERGERLMTTISRLRKKTKDFRKEIIKTVKGGYRIGLPDE